MPPSRAKGPEPRIRTFDEAFAELHLTQPERSALVWRLAMMRAQKTIETLLLPYAPFDPKDVLRDFQGFERGFGSHPFTARTK